MKRKLITAACLLLIAVASAIVAFRMPAGRETLRQTVSPSSSAAGGNSPAASGSSAVSGANVVSGADAGYTLKTYDGRIGVFTADSQVPGQVLNINPDTLPQSEQEKLKTGIHLQTHDELLSYIENFGN